MAIYYDDPQIHSLEQNIADEEVFFAVSIVYHKGKLVLSKHRERDTWEIPGGGREKGETILQCMERELYEETGAIEYDLGLVGYYSVINKEGIRVIGAIYHGEIHVIGELPGFEIEKIDFFDELPENITYPNVHPMLFDYLAKFKNNNLNI